MMLRAATKSADDTRDLAAHVASVARVGDVLLLTGDLGAGKTTFTQGFGRALGVDQQITSPTFTLVHQYPGRDVELVHADMYRLERLHEIVDLALPELIDKGGIAVVEWGEAAAPVLPQEYLQVRVEFGEADDDRAFAFEAVGASWLRRADALRAAVDRWAS
jgi:tRNA threonylcarbamoyladenosine biosynthesis protein TsaE